MLDYIYVVFFWILVFEVLVFSFLNLPTPTGWKGFIIKFLTTNQTIKKLMKAHLVLLTVAAFFLYSSFQTEQKYRLEKETLKADGHGHMGSELRASYLSYTILKIQRNEYITFMLIYASLALNAYITILQYIYDKRASSDVQINPKSGQDVQLPK